VWGGWLLGVAVGPQVRAPAGSHPRGGANGAALPTATQNNPLANRVRSLCLRPDIGGDN